MHLTEKTRKNSHDSSLQNLHPAERTLEREVLRCTTTSVNARSSQTPSDANKQRSRIRKTLESDLRGPKAQIRSTAFLHFLPCSRLSSWAFRSEMASRLLTLMSRLFPSLSDMFTCSRVRITSELLSSRRVASERNRRITAVSSCDGLASLGLFCLIWINLALKQNF